MVDGTRTSTPAGWLDEVCPDRLRRRIRAAQSVGDLLEPLVLHWADTVALLISAVEASLHEAAADDAQFDALAGVVGLKALTDLVDRIGDACALAVEGDCFD